MILFLDFDGVLHPDPCTDRARLFERAPALAAALAPFDSLRLVLSTSWRTHFDAQALAALLPAALGRRVAGSTPLFQDFRCAPALMPYRRQAECLQWLQQNGQAGAEWVALDDRPDGFEPWCERLVVTASAQGIDAAALARLEFALLRGLRRQAAPALG